MSLFASLEKLQSVLQSTFDGFNESSLSQFNEFVRDWSSKSSDIGTDLEIVFRLTLSSILKESSPQAALIDSLLRFSLAFGLANGTLAPNVPKIPYLLVEDLLDGQTISEAERMWTIIENLIDQLIREELFSKGKFVVLRTCNSLLRKLSKSCNTEFCGRVLKFLAAAYTITERSAVNLSGKINTGNETLFEDLQTFTSYRQTPLVSTSAAADMDVDAPIRTTTGSSVEDGEEQEAAVSAIDKEYALYKSFWGLQNYFSSETRVLDADFGVSPDGVVSSGESADVRWSRFSADASAVLDLFASNKFSEADKAQGSLQQQRNLEAFIRSSSQGGGGLRPGKRKASTNAHVESETTMEVVSDVSCKTAESDVYLTSKYLTSSQLFDLQKQDPQLRMEVLTQLIIFCHYFKIRLMTNAAIVSANAAAAAANAQATAATTAARKVRGTTSIANSISTSSTAIAAAAAATAAQQLLERINTVRGVLSSFETKAYELLLETPPDGNKYVAMLKRLLCREAGWIKWKAASCTPFERSPVDWDSLKPVPVAKAPVVSTFGGFRSKPQKAPAGPLTYRDRYPQYISDLSQDQVTANSRKIVERVPSFEDHIFRFLEAEDPENGIEEEYHPKHEGVYCWRARRLLASKKLTTFEKMHDGDLARGLKLLSGSSTSSDSLQQSSEASGDVVEVSGEAIVVSGEAIEVSGEAIEVSGEVVEVSDVVCEKSEDNQLELQPDLISVNEVTSAADVESKEDPALQKTDIEDREVQDSANAIKRKRLETDV